MVQPELDVYGTTYKQFTEDVYADVRAKTFGEDFGQMGLMTTDEHDLFLSWLKLDDNDRLLDVACGSGGPTLRAVRQTGCVAHGIEINEDAIRTARAQVEQSGLADRATFETFDAGERLPFDDDSFNAIVCYDSINHLPNRAERLKDWARVLQPGGRILFTDNIVVTGPITNEEIALRSSFGLYLFVPPGLNDHLLDEVGFTIVENEDRTEQIARIARRWRDARDARESVLRQIESDEYFDHYRRVIEISERLAAERRLSRFAYCARLK